MEKEEEKEGGNLKITRTKVQEAVRGAITTMRRLRVRKPRKAEQMYYNEHHKYLPEEKFYYVCYIGCCNSTCLLIYSLQQTRLQAYKSLVP